MKTIQINLIAKSEISLINKIVYFGLHYLRYIIVITQIVVIAVFFYRFKVDQDIIDLKESVSQKEDIFKITQPLIQEATTIGKKTAFISTVLASQQNFYDDSQFIFNNIPEGIILNSFEMNSNIRIIGMANDVNLIKKLTQILKDSKKYKDVDLSQIEKKDNGYNFVVTLIR